MLDIKDKKLFYLLTENSRMKTSEMAKRVGLSKNAVLYRINRLVSQGYIKKFLAITDYRKFGIHTYDLFLKMRATEPQERRIRGYFSTHPNALWVTTLFGKWDYFVQIAAKDADEFSDVLEGVTVFLGNKLDDYEVKFPARRIKIAQKVFDYEKETGYRFMPAKQDYSETVKLDELDKKILLCLSENGLAPFNEVAKHVGASMETARNRMNALKRSGVIVKYAPMIGYDKLGMLMYLVVVNFRYSTEKSFTQIYSFLNHSSDVKAIFETIGKQEMYFFITVKSPKDLEKFLKYLRYRFHSMILSLEHMVITEELKLDFFPKALASL